MQNNRWIENWFESHCNKLNIPLGSLWIVVVRPSSTTSGLTLNYIRYLKSRIYITIFNNFCSFIFPYLVFILFTFPRVFAYLCCLCLISLVGESLYRRNPLSGKYKPRVLYSSTLVKVIPNYSENFSEYKYIYVSTNFEIHSLP